MKEAFRRESRRASVQNQHLEEIIAQFDQNNLKQSIAVPYLLINSQSQNQKQSIISQDEFDISQKTKSYKKIRAKRKVKVEYQEDSWNDYEDHIRKVNELKNIELTIEELKWQILEEKARYKQERKVFKLITVQKNLETFKEQHRCLYSLRCKRNFDFDDSSAGSISSDECQENQMVFRMMDHDPQEEYVKHLWNQAFVKARAGAGILRFFNDLQRNIYLFGISKSIKNIEKESRVYKFVLMPETRFRALWNIVLIIILLYTVILTPYEIAFLDDTSEAQNMADYIVDFLYFVDIIVTFVSAYENDEGGIVSNPERIASTYLKGSFLIDLFACIPFQSFNISETNTKYQKLLRLMRLPRLFRMIRILKILRQIKFLQDSKFFNNIMKRLQMNVAIIRMIQGMAGSVVITHLFACFWYMSSKFNDFEPDTWVARTKIINLDNYQQYLISFYWSTQTVVTVGYGDIPAETASEMIISLVWMIFGVGFYSFILGNYSSIIAGNIQIQASISIKIKSLKELASRARLPLDLLIKMKKFIENNFESIYNQEEETQLIKILPPSLRDEVLSNTYGEVIETVEFFKELDDPDFLWRILPLLRPIKLERGDVLYFRGDHAEDIFFIISGTIKLYTERGYPYIKYKKGSLFGDSDTLLNLPRDGKAIAMTHLKLMVLKVDQMFEKLFHNQEKNFMNMIFNARKKRNHHLRLIQQANKKRKLRQSIAIKESKKSLNSPMSNNGGGNDGRASVLRNATTDLMDSDVEEEKGEQDHGIISQIKKKINEVAKKPQRQDSDVAFEKKQMMIRQLRKKGYKNSRGFVTPSSKKGRVSRPSILLPNIKGFLEREKNSHQGTPQTFKHAQNTEGFSPINGGFSNFVAQQQSRNGMGNPLTQQNGNTTESNPYKPLGTVSDGSKDPAMKSNGVTFNMPNQVKASGKVQHHHSGGITFGGGQGIHSIASQSRDPNRQGFGSFPSASSQAYQFQNSDLSFQSKLEELRRKEQEILSQQDQEDDLRLPMSEIRIFNPDDISSKSSKLSNNISFKPSQAGTPSNKAVSRQDKSETSIQVRQKSGSEKPEPKFQISKLRIIEDGLHKRLVDKQVQQSIRDRFQGTLLKVQNLDEDEKSQEHPQDKETSKLQQKVALGLKLQLKALESGSTASPVKILP